VKRPDPLAAARRSMCEALDLGSRVRDELAAGAEVAPWTPSPELAARMVLTADGLVGQRVSDGLLERAIVAWGSRSPGRTALVLELAKALGAVRRTTTPESLRVQIAQMKKAT